MASDDAAPGAPPPKPDWHAWHRAYDDPASRLSRRLRVVQDHIRAALGHHAGRVRVISICAGEGRDLLGVLADHPRRDDVSALLVELDPELAARARATAGRLHLADVRVACADAADTGVYADAVPAEVVLACGVFGNISDDDIMHTIGELSRLCSPGATVIWTRGVRGGEGIVEAIRARFAACGFDEVALEASDAETFRVGSHRLAAAPSPFRADVRLFGSFFNRVG
jgi:hypothetical protein